MRFGSDWLLNLYRNEVKLGEADRTKAVPGA